MAIDFFVMPFSRYLSGAFITPTMKLAWSLGTPYTLLLAGAPPRKIPAGEPFGGPDAESRRAAFLGPGMIRDDLEAWPHGAARAWDEASESEPRFHRVDPASYGALLEVSGRARPRRFGLGAPRAIAAHVGCALFLPLDFRDPFETKTIFEGWLAGSIPRALGEIAEMPADEATANARETLRAALEDGAALKLPVIVDL